MNERAVLFGGLAAALGVGAYVNFRYTIRREVLRQLQDVYGYDAMIASNPLYVMGAKWLNVPTAAELADSLVPIVSATLPEKAIEDVLAKGRASDYWPAARRESKAPKAVDNAIFALLRKMYYENQNQPAPVGTTPPAQLKQG